MNKELFKDYWEYLNSEKSTSNNLHFDFGKFEISVIPYRNTYEAACITKRGKFKDILGWGDILFYGNSEKICSQLEKAASL